jgi:anaerobic selenocysteine-containing dehydrogenase
MPWKTYDDALKVSFDAIGASAWDDVAKQGGHWGGSEPPAAGRRSGAQPSASKPAAPPASSQRFTPAQFDGDAAAYPFHFLPFASQAFNDGSASHLPWLQEMPDPMTSAMWSSWIEINPRTADTLHIAQGDIVEVTSSQGALRAPAVLVPGIAPDVVAMPVGQGHERFTRYASGRGANPISILAPVAEAQTGALAWAATRVKLARVGDADGSLILFAGEMREQPHEGKAR